MKWTVSEATIYNKSNDTSEIQKEDELFKDYLLIMMILLNFCRIFDWEVITLVIITHAGGQGSLTLL